MTTETIGGGDDGPPEGYSGHPQTGLDCLRCGAHVKKNRVGTHEEWHEKIDHVIRRVRGGG